MLDPVRGGAIVVLRAVRAPALFSAQRIGQPRVVVLGIAGAQQRRRVAAQPAGRWSAGHRANGQRVSAHPVAVQPCGDELPGQLVAVVSGGRQGVRMRAQVDDDLSLQRSRAGGRRPLRLQGLLVAAALAVRATGAAGAGAGFAAPSASGRAPPWTRLTVPGPQRPGSRPPPRRNATTGALVRRAAAPPIRAAAATPARSGAASWPAPGRSGSARG